VMTVIWEAVSLTVLLIKKVIIVIYHYRIMALINQFVNQFSEMGKLKETRNVTMEIEVDVKTIAQTLLMDPIHITPYAVMV